MEGTPAPMLVLILKSRDQRRNSSFADLAQSVSRAVTTLLCIARVIASHLLDKSRDGIARLRTNVRQRHGGPKPNLIIIITQRFGELTNHERCAITELLQLIGRKPTFLFVSMLETLS